MYEALDKFILFGDIFHTVPVPVIEMDGLLVPKATLEETPALLVDGDCMICKPHGVAFTFAPLLALEDLPNDHGEHGPIRKGEVRRFFYLEPADELDGLAWVADLQSLFSLPRDLFPHKVLTLAQKENRLAPEAYGAFNRRTTRLNAESRERLKVAIALFFELEADDA